MVDAVNPDGGVSPLNAEQAELTLQQVKAYEERALSAAYPRLPWWSIAGKAAIFTSIGIIGDIAGNSYLGLPVMGIVVGALMIGLQELTERRIGIKLRVSRPSWHAAVIEILEVGTILTVMASAGWFFYYSRDTPLPFPSTLIMLTTGLTAAALAQPMQRARNAAFRR